MIKLSQENKSRGGLFSCESLIRLFPSFPVRLSFACQHLASIILLTCPLCLQE